MTGPDATDTSGEIVEKSVHDDIFVETVLKDALEGIHKAASTRITAIGVFVALVTGASASAALTRSYGFFALCLAFLVVLLVIEYFQRNALLSYYYRYIQVTTDLYRRHPDYTWLSGFAPPKLLDDFYHILKLPEKDRGEKMRKCMGPFKYPQFALFLILLIVAYIFLIYYARCVSGWPLLPALGP